MKLNHLPIIIKKPILFISFFSSLCAVFSQEKFVLESAIPINTDFIEVDNLGNIYAVKGDQLQKISTQWKQVNTYSNKILGNISSVDVSNPMKIVVFYRNLSQVVFLDNTLSAQGEAVALETLGLELGTIVCSSVNNGIWVYDQRNFRLVRLDQNLKQMAETGNIIQQAGGELQPVFLIEKNNKVYLSDPERGILVFDIFGTYVKTIPIKNIYRLQAVEDLLFFTTDEKFFRFSLKTLEQNEIVLPETAVRQVLIESNKIYLLTHAALKVYEGKL